MSGARVRQQLRCRLLGNTLPEMRDRASLYLGRLAGPRFIKFCLVGLSGVGVNMGVLAALTELGGLHYMASSPIAIECSFLSNFFLNDLWTWRGVGSAGGRARLVRLGRFHTVYSVGLLLNLAALYSLTEWLGLHYLLSNLIAIALATLWNFWWSAKWTWRSDGRDGANVGEGGLRAG